MEVGFHFAPSGFAVAGQALQQALVVLLGRIKVGVNKRPIFMVTPGIKNHWVFTAPALKAALLLIIGRPAKAVVWVDGGLKVVGYRDHQMNAASGRAAHDPLPCVGRKPAHGSRYFLTEGQSSGAARRYRDRLVDRALHQVDGCALRVKMLFE